MATKEKLVKFPDVTALEGNTEEFLANGDKPICARCGNKGKNKRLFTFIKFGMFEDTFTPVYRCPKCLENTCYTYSVEHEVCEVLK